MGKVIKYIVIALLLAAAAFGVNYLIKYAKIGAGYNAKLACSCHFISGRSIEDISAKDLYAVPLSKQTVDEANKIVTSKVFGLIGRKAIYRPDVGCILMSDDEGKSIADIPSFKVSFPKSELQDSILLGTQKQKLDQILAKNISRGTGSRALLVLKDGKIVGEQYAEGFNKNTSLIGWSMTKSITNAMIGILVRDGILKTENKGLFEEWKEDERREITIDNLLRMSSGLEFEEDYSKVSDATKMLFLEKEAGKYALKSKLKYTPGNEFYYSSGTSNILQKLIRNTFTEQKYYLEFPYRRLFSKLGMTSAIMETDAGGTYVGSSFMFATARDWAKFGQLYVMDGIWNGEQILPPGWVSYSSKITEDSDGEYAAHFWTYPRKDGLPEDSFLMDGYEGQFVLIIPSSRLVIVRLGCTTPSDQFDEASYFKSISDLFL